MTILMRTMSKFYPLSYQNDFIAILILLSYIFVTGSKIHINIQIVTALHYRYRIFTKSRLLEQYTISLACNSDTRIALTEIKIIIPYLGNYAHLFDPKG